MINEKLNDSLLLAAENEVKKDKKYGPEQDLIDTFFKKYPKNTDKLIVAAKIAIIDTTNSTNLARYKSKISLCDVVDIIMGIKDFDARLKQGDVALVEEISRTSKEKYDINLFSFATKYCCYHNVHVYGKDDYSIFDNVVKDHLKDYNTKKHSVSAYQVEKWRTQMDYKAFNNYIGNLLDDYKITLSNRRRAFDYLLWYDNKNEDKNKE